MERIGEALSSIDYSKEIDVRMTIGELMVIHSMLGAYSTVDNVDKARKMYGDEFAQLVGELDVGFRVFRGAQKILLTEGVRT